MPSEIYKTEAKLPIKEIWSFISKMDNWAPLVPGYINHKILSEHESIWIFKTDLGIIKKKIELKVDITSWIEPTRVTFHLTGLNEKMTGSGYFEAEEIDGNQTFMTGYLEIIPGGKMAKVINSKLSKNLSEITKELTDSIILKIKAGENIV